MKRYLSSTTAVRLCKVLAGLLSGALTMNVSAAGAASLLPAGQPAPDLSLATLQGQPVRLSDLRGRVTVLLFGELYNPNSVAACKDLAALLPKTSVSGGELAAYVVITEKAPADVLMANAKRRDVTLPILHDDGRRAFTAYHVMVLPSTVVIDGAGRVVLPCAGYPLDFADTVTDAIMFAGGRISGKEFARRRGAATMPAASESHLRAMRLARLGEELARLASGELAIGKFEEALALDPDCASAHLGLGAVLLKRRDLAGAEKHFLHVLGSAPDSVDAALGLVRIQVIRGGGELKSADERLRPMLRQRPNDPKVIYLAGLVAEESGDPGTALGLYKRAAGLLLYGEQQTWELK